MYKCRYFFDPGSGICLWSANHEAREKFGYPVELNLLGLTDNTLRYGYHVISWYDTYIDWDYPPNPSPWSEEEMQRFMVSANRLYKLLSEELSSDFEIVYEVKTLI
jgi:hypothetical protein